MNKLTSKLEEAEEVEDGNDIGGPCVVLGDHLLRVFGLFVAQPLALVWKDRTVMFKETQQHAISWAECVHNMIHFVSHDRLLVYWLLTPKRYSSTVRGEVVSL